MKLLGRVHRNERGQSIVELAITLPILLMILCGIIDFGWIFSNKLIISYCSREGARYGIVNAELSNASDLIKEHVLESAPDNFRNSMTVDVTFSNPSDHSQGDITVSVKANVDVLTPIIGIFTGEEYIPLESQCVMKIE